MASRNYCLLYLSLFRMAEYTLINQIKKNLPPEKTWLVDTLQQVVTEKLKSSEEAVFCQKKSSLVMKKLCFAKSKVISYHFGCVAF